LSLDAEIGDDEGRGDGEDDANNSKDNGIYSDDGDNGRCTKDQMSITMSTLFKSERKEGCAAY
jgi:hypothetical protein